MPPNNNDALIRSHNQKSWTNKHRNIKYPIKNLYSIWNPRDVSLNSPADLTPTVAAIKSLIRSAEQENVQLRAFGGEWSLSYAAVSDGWMLDTRPLNRIFPLNVSDVVQDKQASTSNLVFVQGGTAIMTLNNFLEDRMKRALKTSGASNGQTIAGAVSTGTHGSAYQFGSMQEYVVGLHIVVGPDRSIWLERASDPVVTNDFADRLTADLIRNDNLFNAALVSFGSFGIIHGVLIEVEPLYLLEPHIVEGIRLNDELRHTMDTLDFTGLNLPNQNQQLFHFEVILNPHSINDGGFFRLMYKHPYTPDHPPYTVGNGGGRPGDDLMSFVGGVNDTIPFLIPIAARKLLNGSVKSWKDRFEGKMGTHGQTFSGTSIRGKVLSTEIGVPLEYTSRAIDCLIQAHNDAGRFGGFFAFRYVKKSNALLAFSKYDTTCTIELPGTFSRRTMRFFNRVWERLEAENIPFTFHWGQLNNLNSIRVRRMYGDAVDQWIQSRHTLLNANARHIFSNHFIRQCGLDG